MSTKPSTVSPDLWSQIEKEQRKDRRVKIISIAAWCTTGLAVLFYAALVFKEFLYIQALAMEGMLPIDQVYSVFIPLVGVIGGIALFIAVLATVGMFFRLRTSSLEELKTRLSALEELVLEHVDSAKG